MWRAAALLVALAVLAARPAAAARELHGLESSLPAAGAHAAVQPRGFGAGFVKAMDDFVVGAAKDALTEQATSFIIDNAFGGDDSSSQGAAQPAINKDEIARRFAENLKRVPASAWSVTPATNPALATWDTVPTTAAASQPEAGSTTSGGDVLQQYVVQLEALHKAVIVNTVQDLQQTQAMDGVAEPTLDMQAFSAALQQYLLSLHNLNVAALKSILSQLLDSSDSTSQATSSSAYP